MLCFLLGNSASLLYSCPMRWIHNFQLFLFDFDGLLVDTEALHFAAYVAMCKARGVVLNWDFERFCKAAHFNSTGLQEALYAEFPELLAQEPRWEVLYQEKKRAYLEVLRTGTLTLLPGVAELLQALEAAGIKRCVATHSPREPINLIKERLPLLQTIPLWITREDYVHPKPSPDSYRKAVSLLGAPGDRIIGFEDSFRGIQALRGVECTPILVCPPDHPQMREPSLAGVQRFSSLKEIKDVT